MELGLLFGHTIWLDFRLWIGWKNREGEMEGGSFDGGDCGGSMRGWCVVGEEIDYVGEGSCYG